MAARFAYKGSRSPSSCADIAKVGLAMKLLDQVRHVARVKHFSYRTEQCYVYWITRFIRRPIKP